MAWDYFIHNIQSRVESNSKDFHRLEDVQFTISFLNNSCKLAKIENLSKI